MLINGENIDISYPTNNADDLKCIEPFLSNFPFDLEEKLAISIKKLTSFISEKFSFSERELKIGTFDFSEVEITNAICSEIRKKIFDNLEYELVFNFVGTEENYWLDTYGLWIASFKGENLTNVRREQV